MAMNTPGLLTRRNIHAALVLAAAILTTGSAAYAQDVVRVGKTASNALAFSPPEIGAAKGIWEKHGLKVQVQQYAGDARMQQGMIANEIDFGLGSGPSMGFIARKAPIMTVGVIADQPLSMGLITGKDSKYKKPEDLKGSRVGITTNGSLTYWLARELSRRMGWGPDGIRMVPLGSITGQIAGLKSGQVDGFIMSASVGYMLDEKNEGEVMLHFGDMIPDFHTHVVFANNRIVKDKPDVIRRFLVGWMETVEFMRTNPEEAIVLASKVTGIPVNIQRQEFGKVMPMMSKDMRFKESALRLIVDSFQELKILDFKPDPKTLYTEEFLPTAKR
ncbi:MAG: ABC transporter substrate-binding protein [Beijerinckiaceae bacterium]|nr:ABC transporter substrate-binding protein [Beijerinckiaceae bacterium]